MPKSEGCYTVFNTTLELQVLDLVNKDNNNRMDVMSDTQQIIADIVTEFSTHPYYMDNSIDTVSDISFDPIRGAYGGDVDGWKISVTLEHPVKLSYCGNPVENIQGFDFSAPTKVTVTDNENPNSPLELYGGDTYTCITGEPKAGIQYHRVSQPQETSYDVYDEGWNWANGKRDYDVPPNPVSVATLDYATDPSGRVLLNNNAFGNKFRFTDAAGNESLLNTVGQYVVDNFTGLGWSDARNNTYGWYGKYTDYIGIGGELENHNTNNLLGYNDWTSAGITELSSLMSKVEQSTTNYCLLPLLGQILTPNWNFGSSTTNDFTGASTYIMGLSRRTGSNAPVIKTYTANIMIPVRIHF